MWLEAAFANEFTLLLPVLLWASFRQTWAQKLVDVWRTVPLLAAVTVEIVGGGSSAWIWAAVVAWTVVANVAQYRIDEAVIAGHQIKFPQLTYELLQISVVQWLIGALAPPSRLVRGSIVALNLAAVAVVAADVAIARPLTLAWICYPSRAPKTWTRGYCPQYTGQYDGNAACSFVLDKDQNNPRCDPKTWDQGTSLHDTMGVGAHVALHVIAITAALHLASIPSAVLQARVDACISTAHGHAPKKVQ